MKHLTPFSSASILAVLLLSVHPAVCSAADANSAAPAADAAKPAKPEQALRIYLKSGSRKSYVRGYQWTTLDLNRKISLIESARRGALKMNAVMAMPAEVYVREVDKFFAANPSLMQMEVGQVIQGVAMSIKDWNTGSTGA